MSLPFPRAPITSTSPTVPAAALFSILESGFTSLLDLCEHLHCTLDELESTLEDPAVEQFLRVKTRIAALQAQVTAINYLPIAIAKLQNLSETADKPEVVRRSTTTLINIAGISTTAQHPPITPQAPPEKQYAQPPKDTPWDIAMDYAAKMVTLRNAHGIDINNIPDHLYDTFTKVLYNFFIAYRLPFSGYVGSPYELDENPTPYPIPDPPTYPNDPPPTTPDNVNKPLHEPPPSDPPPSVTRPSGSVDPAQTIKSPNPPPQ